MSLATQASSSAWTAERPQKGLNYYKSLRDEYSAFISGDERLPMPSVMEAVAAKTIALLIVDVKSRKCKTFNGQVMEENLKALDIGAMWDILLETEEAAKSLAETPKGSTWAPCRAAYLYLRVSMYITEDHWGLLFGLRTGRGGISNQRYAGHCDQ